jgi:hypothetical protein
MNVPAALGLPEIVALPLDFAAKLSPAGRAPDSETAAAGVPVVVTRKLSFFPTVAVVSAALVNVGVAPIAIDSFTVAVPAEFFAVSEIVKVPAAVGVPMIEAVPFPLFVKAIPFGRVPDSAMVGTGVPVVVTLNWKALPTSPTAETALVNFGATGTAATVNVNVWTAFGLAPLAATTVNVKIPATVGVPASVALPLAPAVNATPVGKVPVSDSVATGVPVDVTEKVNFVPTVAEADAALVIFGATGARSTVIVNCCVAVPLAFFAVRVSDEVPTVVGMP